MTVSPGGRLAARLAGWRRGVAAAAPTEARQVVRIVVAATVSWQLCVWLGATQPPVYAVIVPVVALRDAPDSVFDVSLGRLVGVVAGLAVGVAILSWLRPSALTVALVLGVALAIGVVLRAAGSLNVQVAVSALLVFASSDPSTYAVSRLWETAVGAAVTIVLAPLLLPTNPARAFRTELREVAEACSGDLLAVADLLAADDPGTGEDDAAAERLRERTRHTEVRALALAPRLATARRAVRLDPVWRRRHGPGLATLGPAADAAADVAASVRLYADDVAELGRRPDVREWWERHRQRNRETVLPLAAAVTAPLSGRSAPEAVAGLRAALEAHREADPSLLGAVFRRPLWRITGVLAGLEGIDPTTLHVGGADPEDPGPRPPVHVDGSSGSEASGPASSRPSGGT